MGSSRVDRLLAIGLGASAFALYLGWGLAFDREAPDIFRDNDRAFDADTPNRIICLTRRDGAHYLTRLHPLFVVALNPPGLALRAGLDAAGVARPGRVAAVALTSLAGGLGVALLLLLLRRLGVDRLLAFLWALLFGLSSSQMLFGFLPETFVFSAASLLLVLVVFFRERRSEPLRLAASVAAFGMAGSNLALVVLLRAAELFPTARALEAARRIGVRVAQVLVVAALLSLVQHAVYPRTVYFFARGGVPADDLLNIYWPQDLADATGRAGEVLAHFFLANLVAPPIDVMGAGTIRPAIRFAPGSWSGLRGPGLAFALGWAAVLVVGLAKGARAGFASEPAGQALVAWLALHLALHSVFGQQLFLYSCHWTFAVLVVTALAWRRGLERAPAWRRPLAAALAGLAVLGAASNTAFLGDVFAVFG